MATASCHFFLHLLMDMRKVELSLASSYLVNFEVRNRGFHVSYLLQFMKIYNLLGHKNYPQKSSIIIKKVYNFKAFLASFIYISHGTLRHEFILSALERALYLLKKFKHTLTCNYCRQH